MTSRPHDALVKAALGNAKHAAEFFQHVLPPATVAMLDWATLAIESGSLVDEILDDSHTDLLFTIGVRQPTPHERRPRRIHIYLHCEHQSSLAADLPLRMLDYEVEVWRRFADEHPGEPLPPILPILFAQVPDGWTAPSMLLDLFATDACVPGIVEYLPRFAPIVIDLAHLTNAELVTMTLDAFPKVALWFLRDARNFDQLMTSLAHWWDSFCVARAAPNGITAFSQLMHYAFTVLPPKPFATFHDKIRLQLTAAEENIVNSYADHLRQEGREKGRQETRAETHERLVAVLRKLLLDKFTTLASDDDRRIAEASIELLCRYLERTATAQTVADVFAA